MQNPIKLEECKIIRKLGEAESLYDNELINENMFQTRAFIISISKKYLFDINVLNKAVQTWVKIHPLLKATTYRTLDSKTLKSKIKLPKYFIYMNKNIEEYNNVEILNESDNLLWTDLVESELRNPLDYINGPLWRLKVLKIDEKSDSDKYAFILTTSHSISDGRNGYSIGIQLINLIIDTLENKLEDEIIQISSDYTCEELVEEFKTKFKSEIKKEENNFDFSTHRLPNNVGNSNGLHGRFDLIFLKSESLQKLIKKMKLNAPKAKFTSLLSILLCESYRNVCINYKVDNIPLENVQIPILISLRDKLNVDNLQMGVYSDVLFSNVYLVDMSEEKLWRLAEKEAALLHQRIKNNEEMIDQDSSDFYENIENGFDFANNTSNNFCLSNIGIMNNTKNPSIVKVNEHYVAVPCLENRFGAVLQFGITTVDNNLNIGICFNEKIFSKEFVLDMKKIFMKNIDKLIQS